MNTKKTDLSKTSFQNYRKGQEVSLIIAPICEEKEVPEVNEKSDAPPRAVKKKVCAPHADTPEKQLELFTELSLVLLKHGFTLEVFGHPVNMLSSLHKRHGKELSEIIWYWKDYQNAYGFITLAEYYTTIYLPQYVNNDVQIEGEGDTVSK